VAHVKLRVYMYICVYSVLELLVIKKHMHMHVGRFLYLTHFLINISILTVPENNLHPVVFFGRAIPMARPNNIVASHALA
jgi:hypothetical protein